MTSKTRGSKGAFQRHRVRNVASNCVRKTRHSTKGAAISEAKRSLTKLRGIDPLDAVYECHHCGGWHIGKPSGHDLKRRMRNEA